MNEIGNNLHVKFMRRCFELAKRGAGFVSPNPMVGAVIVKNGKIIGEGYHRLFGGNHAEVDAFNNCIENPEGADMYINLEPCSHTNKKTPPCAPLVINRKIKRLFVSNTDPNPLVSGKGIKLIEESGIEVNTGILEEEGKEINKFFFKFITKGVPYVTIKTAVSQDGFISKEKGKQTWITGEETKEYVHKLRSEYDAVLVGAKTVKIDNPLLNVRAVKGRNPIRVILDGRLSIPANSHVILTADEERTIILTSARTETIERFNNNGAEIIQLTARENNYIPLNQVLCELGKLKISSLLVEGGAEIFTQFIQTKLANELHLIEAPVKFGAGVPAFLQKIKLSQPHKQLKLGKDFLSIYSFEN